MNEDLTIYKRYKTFWGLTFPRMELVNANGQVFAYWDFSDDDGFKINFRCEKDMIREVMENKSIRDMVNGYWFYAEIYIKNTDNRDLMMFLAKADEADYVRLWPHPGVMMNPDTGNYSFEMLVESDFEPIYIPDGRWGGHELTMILKSRVMLKNKPLDQAEVMPLAASEITVAGETSADEQTSVTFFNEKMFLGDWEITDEDFAYVAFFEAAPPGEGDPYGEIW